MNLSTEQHIEDSVAGSPRFAVELKISDEWEIFNPREPGDVDRATAQFDALAELINVHGDEYNRLAMRQIQHNTRIGLAAFGQAGVSVLGTWARMLVKGDSIEPLAGWFTLAVVETPNAGDGELSVEREGIIADALTSPSPIGAPRLVTAEEIELLGGSSLKVVWEVLPEDGSTDVFGYRTTEYLLPLADSAARALLTCTCLRTDLADDWDAVFRAVADSMDPRVVEGSP
jgi:hypothetical protein